MEVEDALRYDGVHTYRIKLPNIVWKSFEVPLQPPPITSATLTTNDDGTELTIQTHYTGAVEPEQARMLTEEATRKIINRLAYHLNVFLQEPIYIAGSITAIHSDGHKDHFVSCVEHLGLTDSATRTHYYGDEATDCLKEKLGTTLPIPGEAQYDLYRTLLAGSDSVAKFLSFYLVLMSFHDDKQPEVETFIRRWEPTVRYEKTDPPRERKMDWTQETVYTRLRNQVGHSRQVSLRDTRAEMDTYLTGLMNLVRKCIEING